MQERRMTVRAAFQTRAQYCAAEDLLPCDGRLINISERGAGLQAREARKTGEQVTVSFSLPGSADAMTTTGLVRWSSPASKSKWHTAGLEWLPLEEGSRNRLHGFLRGQPPGTMLTAAPTTAAAAGKKIYYSWVAMAALFIVFASVMSWHLNSIQQRTEKLEWGLQQRSAVIGVLKDREQRMAKRETWLRQELVTAKQQLAIAGGEMTRLNEQARSVSADAQRLRQEVDYFQQSYTKAQQERSGLIQEVMGLEQERLKLVGKLSSLPELQRAIREAIELRKQEKRSDGVSWIRLPMAPGTIADKEISPEDNQGFIIRDGRLFGRRGSGMSIKVLEPEAIAAP